MVWKLFFQGMKQKPLEV